MDSNGLLVADSGAFSPRLGLMSDHAGDQKWSVTASVAKYVAGLLNSIADMTSPAGNPDQYNFVYTGPSINTDPATIVPNEVAIQRMIDWFNANGGATLPLTGSPSVSGVSPQVRGSLESPSAGSNQRASAVSSAPVRRCAPTSCLETTAASMCSGRISRPAVRRTPGRSRRQTCAAVSTA